MTVHSSPSRPWYKEFWPWLILAILGSSVIAGTTFLVLSITSFDGMVEDNYYKHGLAINRVIEQDHRAAALGLTAELRVDDLTGDVGVTLHGEARPERLYLRLIFPTQGDRDLEVILEHVRGGQYVGQAPRQLEYRRYLQLAPAQDTPAWRLTGEAHFPLEASATLSAKAPAEAP